MTHASSPALHTYDGVALVQHAELNSVHNTPCKAAVDILLPRSCAEVGFRLREVEGVDTTVEMRVLFKLVEVWKREVISGTYAGGHSVSGNHDDWADGSVFGNQARSVTAGHRQL